MKKTLCILTLVICFVVTVPAGQEPQTLVPSKPVEREIAGGETHVYQITMAAGQYVRFRLDQRAVDATLILSAPDGKPLVEMSLTRAGDEESLSFEAAIAGNYRLTVRVGGLATLRGTYRLQAVQEAAATAQDKQRIAAESLMIESEMLLPQAGKAAAKIIENMQQTRAIWREGGRLRCQACDLQFSDSKMRVMF